jgi:hypothetical protein
LIHEELSWGGGGTASLDDQTVDYIDTMSDCSINVLLRWVFLGAIDELILGFSLVLHRICSC